MKRTLDIVVSAVALILLLPVLCAIAVAVVLDSGWPVFYTQIRVGRHFVPFRLWKFRSMLANNCGPPVTVAGDARVTRVGRFLRRVKLDELPQFWNVLMGDMSLVGPRPEVPKYVDMFRERYARILVVRPGITDPASLHFRNEEEVLAAASDPISGYTDTVLPAKLDLSERYVNNRSFIADIAILVATALAVVRRT